MGSYSNGTIYAPEEMTELKHDQHSFRGTWAGENAEVPAIMPTDTAAICNMSVTHRVEAKYLGVDNVNFENLTLDGEVGAALRISGIISISGSTFANNKVTGKAASLNGAYSRGGAIYTNAGLTVDAGDGDPTLFVNNSATGHGGAICSYYTVDVTGATFSGNKSTNSYGGAIYSSSGNFTNIINTLFVDNSASLDGGALYITTVGASTPSIGNVIS